MKINYINCEKCKEKVRLSSINRHLCNINYTCEKCGNNFTKEKRIKKGRLVHCSDCKKTAPHSIENPESIMNVSARTAVKILKRAGIKCGMCGWDKTTLDLHHVIERKNGGSDWHSNLAPLCPNCHRMAHEGYYTKEQLSKVTLNIVFSNWLDFYHVSN